jgi:hypothetical protein
MERVLILTDGTELEFTEDSTINHLYTDVDKFGQIDTLKSKLTRYNLAEATFDGLPLKDMELDSMVVCNTKDTILVHIILKTII